MMKLIKLKQHFNVIILTKKKILLYENYVTLNKLIESCTCT